MPKRDYDEKGIATLIQASQPGKPNPKVTTSGYPPFPLRFGQGHVRLAEYQSTCSTCLEQPQVCMETDPILGLATAPAPR